MEKTWKPTVGGILAIISGAFEVIAFLVLFVFFIPPPPFFVGWPLLGPVGTMLIVLVVGIIAIVGGICALLRKTWGLALAGSICALPAGVILGVLAIIFIVLGKREFR
ncbi:MAG TPA: hypothetical protein VEG43_01435 [Dehalococcoidia bacterium]|nr:hypothetical protein [Dehalococcoidia bacterium]